MKLRKRSNVIKSDAVPAGATVGGTIHVPNVRRGRDAYAAQGAVHPPVPEKVPKEKAEPAREPEAPVREGPSARRRETPPLTPTARRKASALPANEVGIRRDASSGKFSIEGVNHEHTIVIGSELYKVDRRLVDEGIDPNSSEARKVRRDNLRGINYGPVMLRQVGVRAIDAHALGFEVKHLRGVYPEKELQAAGLI